MPSQFNFNAGPAKQQLEAELTRRLSAAAIVVETHAKQLVSIAGTGGAPGRDAKGRFKRAYGSNPSAPGEPPHKQKDHLRRSITWELVGKTARIGTNLLYGRWLELGTKNMLARPWLRRALAETKTQVLAILSKPFTLK